MEELGGRKMGCDSPSFEGTPVSSFWVILEGHYGVCLFLRVPASLLGLRGKPKGQPLFLGPERGE